MKNCCYLVLLLSTFVSSNTTTGIINTTFNPLNNHQQSTTTQYSLDSSTPKSTPSVPLEFPSVTNQNYSFIENSTIRKTLADHAVKNDTEVDDLLGLDNPKPQTIAITTAPIIIPNPSEEDNDDVGLKNETELIEDDDEKTEDHKFDKIDNDKDRGGQGLGVFDGQVAAILIGTCLSICLLGYIALMIWRRYVE